MEGLSRDVVLCICRYLNAPDVFSLLSSCHRLRSFKCSLTTLRFALKGLNKGGRRPPKLNGVLHCLLPFNGLRVLDMHSIPLRGEHFDVILGRMMSISWLSVTACPYFHQGWLVGWLVSIATLCECIYLLYLIACSGPFTFHIANTLLGRHAYQS